MASLINMNNEYVIDADEKKFEEILLNSEVPVLVDFWSPSCASCQVQSAVIEEAAESYQGQVVFVKVNVAEVTQVAANMRIRSIPTIVIFKDTKVVDIRVGLTSRKALDSMLDRALGKSLWKRWFG